MGAGILLAACLSSNGDGAHVRVVTPRRVLVSRWPQGTMLALLGSYVLRSRTKQLPTLPGGGGEDDGDQIFKTEGKVGFWCFAQKHHASCEQETSFCPHD